MPAIHSSMPEKIPASSVYSTVDERNILWYSTVFSAAEQESAFVIDSLMHNDVIKSDIHSTDTHGYSEVIFGATHLLEFSYAPRIKNLKKPSSCICLKIIGTLIVQTGRFNHQNILILI
ncbi:MAG: Tn3 family transposase [Nitrosomonas sp.]|nr:Tn3 family transposase [Nitrosomonas sp.]